MLKSSLVVEKMPACAYSSISLEFFFLTLLGAAIKAYIHFTEVLHVQAIVGPLKFVHIPTQEKNEKCEYKPEGFSFQLEVQYNLEAVQALKLRPDKTFLKQYLLK